MGVDVSREVSEWSHCWEHEWLVCLQERMAKVEQSFSALCKVEESLHQGLLGFSRTPKSLEPHLSELTVATDNLSNAMLSHFGRGRRH